MLELAKAAALALSELHYSRKNLHFMFSYSLHYNGMVLAIKSILIQISWQTLHKSVAAEFVSCRYSFFEINTTWLGVKQLYSNRLQTKYISKHFLFCFILYDLLHFIELLCKSLHTCSFTFSEISAMSR